MAQSKEIKEVLLQIYQAMSSGDVPGMLELISHEEGTLVIGTDPREWWRGFDTINRFFSVQIKEMGGVKVIPGEIEAFQEGKVGWAADYLTLRFPDGIEARLRGTAVFKQEAGSWKMVQWHVSTGTLNEETIGKELTV